jgi:hypothetical protein
LQARRASASPVGSQFLVDGTFTLPEGAAQAVRSAAPTQRHAISLTSFTLDVFIFRACHKALRMSARRGRPCFYLAADDGEFTR